MKKTRMTNKQIHKTLTYAIAAVWLVNGLFCKVLNFVPRHEQIVARILGRELAPVFTQIIGISEIFMAIWILSGIKPRLNTWAQILIVATMNILEFILVPDLLLWGKGNALFAFLFILLVFYNENIVGKFISRTS
jgi:DoxX-like family